MKKAIGLVVIALVISGCSTNKGKQVNNGGWLNSQALHNGTLDRNQSQWQKGKGIYPITPFDKYISQASTRYQVDETLIRAIIEVESSYRPDVISKSNAVGLMQIKASTAGRDAYRAQGRSGEPTLSQLLDPATNIDIGTTYIRVIRDQHLAGISNPETLHYATVVSYVNGAGALLRTFDNNRQVAIGKINKMTPDEFYQHVQTKHPAPQAPRYLWKVKNAYRSLAMAN